METWIIAVGYVVCVFLAFYTLSVYTGKDNKKVYRDPEVESIIKVVLAICWPMLVLSLPFILISQAAVKKEKNSNGV